MTDTIDYAAHLRRVRETAPLVHNITNHVAMNPMANILLALGASPAMAHAPEEVAEFARMAGALTINIGTLSQSWLEAMVLAARAAREAATPWVLDPVAVGASAFRRDACARLLGLAPTVIRGNASEILALAGRGGAGRGVDSSDPIAAAEDAAVALARDHGTVVALTGEVDRVTDGRGIVRVFGGSALMTRVTAIGCGLTGVVGSFVAGGAPVTDATISALASYAVAGEWAARAATGPGSFWAPFVDALYTLTPEDLATAAQVSWHEAP